jgi:hypothetical protein
MQRIEGNVITFRKYVNLSALPATVMPTCCLFVVRVNTCNSSEYAVPGTWPWKRFNVPCLFMFTDHESDRGCSKSVIKLPIPTVTDNGNWHVVPRVELQFVRQVSSSCMYNCCQQKYMGTALLMALRAIFSDVPPERLYWWHYVPFLVRFHRNIFADGATCHF